jgi:hypothetical protein
VTHNALSRSMGTIPMWVVQAVVGLLLTSGVAWATWASVTTWKHDTRLGIVETKVETVKDDIKEIKDGQREILQKLDKMNDKNEERSHQPRIYGR